MTFKSFMTNHEGISKLHIGMNKYPLMISMVNSVCQVVFYTKFKVLSLALFKAAKLWVVIIYRIVDNSDKTCYDLW